MLLFSEWTRQLKNESGNGKFHWKIQQLIHQVSLNNRQYLKQSLQFGICVERRFGHCRFEGYMGVKKSRQKQLGKMEAGCQCHGVFSGIISQFPSPFVRIYGQKKLDLFLSLRDSSVQPCSGGTTNFWQKNVKRYRGHSTVYATFLATFYQI